MDRNHGHTYGEQVSGDHAGRRVLDHLAARYAHSDRTVWSRRIAAGEVWLDDEPATTDRVLIAGERLEWRRPPWREPAVPTSFAILYRDDDLLAVAKPRGLPTMPRGGRFLENTLLRRVQRIAPEAAPLHRLGAGTSGVLLFARSRVAAREVSRQFAEGALIRRYRAWIQGSPDAVRRTIDLPIGRVEREGFPPIHAVSARGRPARTHVTLIEPRDGTSLVDVTIDHGRPHQIRVHLAAIGHPLVGEPLYAPGGLPDPSSPALPTDGGFWLHAASLTLRHPVTGSELIVECAPPPILRSGATSNGAEDSG